MPDESLHTTPAPGEQPEATDLAAPERIRETRHLVATTVGEFGLAERGAEERRGGSTLSAQELRFVRAALTFLRHRGDVGAAAGVPAATFTARAGADLALSRLGRAAAELEATAAVGEILLGARLTAQNDRVLLHASEPGGDPKRRARLRTYLASADLIYEREVQLVEGRRERAALRERRREAALQESASEADRLGRREQMIDAVKRREEP